MLTEKITKLFYENIAQDYEIKHHPARPGSLVERKIIVGEITRLLEEGSIVLDLGSGTGIWTRLLYDQGNSYYDLDVAFNMVKISKDKFDDYPNNTRVSFIEGHMGNIPFRDRTFKVVICMYSFGHARRRPKVCEEIQRVLAENGCLIIAVDGPWFNISRSISQSKLHDFLNALLGKGCDKINTEKLRDNFNVPIYVHHYSFSEISKDLAQHKFKIVDAFGCMIPFAFLPYPILKKMRKCVNFFQNRVILRLDKAIRRNRVLMNFSPHIICIARMS